MMCCISVAGSSSGLCDLGRLSLSISCQPDEAAAEDKVTFTPGKKPSRLEALMTKEEVEEEQRSVHSHCLPASTDALCRLLTR